MTMRSGDTIPDHDRLLFGAGFVFGVAVTLVILAVVLVAVTDGRVGADGLAGQSVLLTVLGGVVVAGLIGLGLTLLAFPTTRTRVPLGGDLLAEDGGEEGVDERNAEDDE